MIDVTTPDSPGWWLKTLSKKITARADNISLLRSYMNGDSPLPEGAAGLTEAYQAFQRKARTNFGSLIVEAVSERMTPTGFIVDGAKNMDDKANVIWAANQLDVFSGEVHHDMLGVGDGYAIVGKDDNGKAVITREDPAYIVTAQDPLRPHIIRAALKLFRDDVLGTDYAYVYLPGEVWCASRTSVMGPAGMHPASDVGNFEWIEDTPVVLGGDKLMPVVRFRNHDGFGEFETHLDILERINYMVLQRLVIVALQAFHQRAIKGDLPETDEEGKDIDYGDVFRPGAGALWMLPDGVDLWESETTDIGAILNGTKDDIRALAACTKTPMSVLMPDSANQSAEGASFAREGLVFKAIDRQKRATYGWNEVMKLALTIEGEDTTTVSTQWTSAERRTLAERADAASKATDIPWATKMRYIWQFSPDVIARMETERLSDILATNLGAATDDGADEQ